MLTAAILAFVAHRVRAYGGRSFWAFIVLAQTMVFVQAILGVALQSDEKLTTKRFSLFVWFLNDCLYCFTLRIQVAGWRKTVSPLRLRKSFHYGVRYTRLLYRLIRMLLASSFGSSDF